MAAESPSSRIDIATDRIIAALVAIREVPSVSDRLVFLAREMENRLDEARAAAGAGGGGMAEAVATLESLAREAEALYARNAEGS